MIDTSIDSLYMQYPEQRDLIMDTLEAGVPTTVDLAEHRGTGVYLFNEGRFWQFPAAGYYLTIPLWWLYERDLLQYAEDLIMPAAEASGMFSVELQPNIAVEQTDDGVAITQSSDDYVGDSRQSITVSYRDVSIEHLLQGNVQVMYGDHICHVCQDNIRLDDIELSL